MATDIQFISVLENQARLKGDGDFADVVLKQLDVALTYLDEQLNKEHFYKKMFSIYVAQSLVALTFVKKFNYTQLQNKKYLNAVKAIDKHLPLFINSAIQSYTTGYASWNTTFFGPGSGTITYEQLTKEKRHVISENGIKQFAGSLNVYSTIGGALGIYGALLSGVSSKQYEHRSKIVDLGHLAIDMSLSGNRSIGHLNNIGGGRTNGGTISTGYASWVARGLAQMATGTTFDLYHPTSIFMKEANDIKQGLLTVLSRKGYMPDTFSSFNGSNPSTDGKSLLTDKSVYLYELSWCGDQIAIDTMERHLSEKHGIGKTNPIIIDSLLSDESQGGSNAHRALAGLTAGMIKGLNFNYG